jgi:hypothetical protein
MVIAGVNNTE